MRAWLSLTQILANPKNTLYKERMKESCHGAVLQILASIQTMVLQRAKIAKNGTNTSFVIYLSAARVEISLGILTVVF